MKKKRAFDPNYKHYWSKTACFFLHAFIEKRSHCLLLDECGAEGSEGWRRRGVTHACQEFTFRLTREHGWCTDIVKTSEHNFEKTWKDFRKSLCPLYIKVLRQWIARERWGFVVETSRKKVDTERSSKLEEVPCSLRRREDSDIRRWEWNYQRWGALKKWYQHWRMCSFVRIMSP